MSSAYIAPDSGQGIRDHCALSWTPKIPSRPFVPQLLKLGSGSKGLSSGSKGRGGRLLNAGHAPVWNQYGPCVDGSGLARGIIFTLQQWSEQPCVRPVCAVLMTAGHNALRGSGPGQ